jgi:hypothetical protein
MFRAFTRTKAAQVPWSDVVNLEHSIEILVQLEEHARS